MCPYCFRYGVIWCVCLDYEFLAHNLFCSFASCNLTHSACICGYFHNTHEALAAALSSFTQMLTPPTAFFSGSSCYHSAAIALALWPGYLLAILFSLTQLGHFCLSSFSGHLFLPHHLCNVQPTSVNISWWLPCRHLCNGRGSGHFQPLCCLNITIFIQSCQQQVAFCLLRFV